MTRKTILTYGLSIGLFLSALPAQIAPIQDGESGLSVRTKLNSAIDEINSFDLSAYQLIFADSPRLDWALGKAYGPSGVLDSRLDWESRVLSGSWTIDYLSVTGLTIGSSVSLPAGSVPRNAIQDDAVGPNQLDELGHFSMSSLTLLKQSADPSDPAVGQSVVWMSDGTGAGDPGDIMVKVNSASTVNTFTLVDFAP